MHAHAPRGLQSLFVAGLLVAQPLATLASAVCDAIASTTNIEILQRLSLPYTQEQTEYWSTSCSALKPGCILTPTTVDEVAAIVRVLRDSNETFAIKSGGHNPNDYFASVQDGPLISTKELNTVVLDAASETVRIGPGNRWDDVTEALDGTGYAVVSGRIGNVGVGGLVLGGGLSFMSGDYGWAASNVLAYELVLANASIVTVTNTSHPDLFLALRGGGNTYGIVTSFTVAARPIAAKVWSGQLFIQASPDTDKAMVAAVRDFTANHPDKAGIIPTAVVAGAGILSQWVVFLFYNGESPPPGTFDMFLDKNPTINTCKPKTLHEFITENNFGVIKGTIYTIGTETLPLPRVESSAGSNHTDAGLDLMQSVFSHWRDVVDTVYLKLGLTASIALQPFPRRMAAAAAAAEPGDLLGIEDDGLDRIIIEINYSFSLPSDTPDVDAAMQATYGGFRERVLDFGQRGLVPQDAYLPLFANDAYYRQDYWGRLRPDRRQLAEEVRDAVDPEGLWRDRTGGFKL